VGVSSAIWIPFIWMFFAGSRYASQWLSLGSSFEVTNTYLDGSPIDRAVFLILEIVGVIILVRRRLNWKELFTQNIWICLFFIFGAISILWSDYPFVSSKRLFKALGNIIMVLVILTEVRPYAALGVVLRRLSFLFLPLSVLFIKYYPDIGRAYHMGRPMFAGVSDGKNGLGTICLISGIYFSWNLLFNRRDGVESGSRLHFSIYLIILPMIAWLFNMADSATSFACMVIAICLFLVGRQPVVSRKPLRILTISITFIALYSALELVFDMSGTIIEMLGRRPDLTTRVPMWEDLLSMVKNPIVGFGYESFWLGDRQKTIMEKWRITLSAHNGYLEMYLNLGLIGLFILVGWFLSGLRKVAHLLVIDYPAAILKLCFIVVLVLHNWTEAAFYATNIMWIIFMLATIEVPGNSPLNNSAVERVD
jgi:exopolysaccharide production protein ExoQ